MRSRVLPLKIIPSFIVDAGSVSTASRYNMHSENLASRNRICSVLWSSHAKNLEVSPEFLSEEILKLAIGKPSTANDSWIPF